MDDNKRAAHFLGMEQVLPGFVEEDFICKYDRGRL